MSTLWLRDLLPTDVPEARILSYGYESSKFSMKPVEEIAEDLMEEIVRVREGINVSVAFCFGKMRFND